jgi:DNA-binding FrmR family transcriptional regulator
MNKFPKGGKNMEQTNLTTTNIITTTPNSPTEHQPTEAPTCENCRHKAKERDTKEYKDLISRLNRIEGQIRGIKKMVENGAYCPDILIQASAANAALNSFSRALLSDHIKTCVTDDIKSGKEETVDELISVLQKMMK